ncbi:MAG: 4a-hydroxytetrahydrobiopterin dehydratase [Chthoniobacterales bacterium]
MEDLLSEPQIGDYLTQISGWVRLGSEIRREFKFKNFLQAMNFVNAVAEAAEKSNHHPDIDIRWNTVVLRLSTHSKGGLTELDFKMAGTINGLI